MAQAILLPLIENSYLLPEQILGVVGKKESIKKIKDKLPKGITLFSACDPSSIDVWKAPVILLGIKPNQIDSLRYLKEKGVPDTGASKNLLISILAGVGLTKLEDLFSNHACVRAVPNAPVLVAAGLTGLAWGNGLTNDQRSQALDLFKSISKTIELPEKQLDAFLALTSSGPAFLALIVEAISDGAVAAGLPRHLACDFAKETLIGTGRLLKDKDLHPGELKDMVASPGGTTITGLRALENAGVRGAFIEAVIKAAEKSRQLG